MKRLFLVALGLNFVVSHEFFQPEETEIVEASNFAEQVELTEQPVSAAKSSFKARPNPKRQLDTESEEFQDAIGYFFLGLILLPFTCTFLWMNEKKLVTYRKCMGEAMAEVTSCHNTEPLDENDGKLVHCHGNTTNENDLVDEPFGVVV